MIYIRFRLMGLLLAALATQVLVGQHQALTLAQFQQRVDTDTDTLWVVDFYASWCRPCLDATLHLLEVHPRYAGKPVRFVGVSVDESPADWQAYLNRFQPAWPQLRIGRQSESSWFQERFPYQGIPALFVVEPHCRIREVPQWWQLERVLDKALARQQRSTGA
jgi:thiol-disulfide isomerase/thioredoxin